MTRPVPFLISLLFLSRVDRTWTFENLCFKPPFVAGHSDAKIKSLIYETFDKIIPCFIISPLDCFWEGAKLLGPPTPFQ